MQHFLLLLGRQLVVAEERHVVEQFVFTAVNLPLVLVELLGRVGIVLLARGLPLLKAVQPFLDHEEGVGRFRHRCLLTETGGSL